jgi:hypothetical protein
LEGNATSSRSMTTAGTAIVGSNPCSCGMARSGEESANDGDDGRSLVGRPGRKRAHRGHDRGATGGSNADAGCTEAAHRAALRHGFRRSTIGACSDGAAPAAESRGSAVGRDRERLGSPGRARRPWPR